MPKFISKVEKERTIKDLYGRDVIVTGSYLVDNKGHILHDKSREDDPEGVARRIEVEAFKESLRQGIAIRQRNEDGSLKLDKEGNVVFSLGGPVGKPIRFYEQFPGTAAQAEKEMEEEIKMRADIEKEYREKLDAKLKEVNKKK
jgi:hypothetical protein